MNVNPQSATTAQVSNPEVAVAVVPEPKRKTRRISTRQEASADLRQRAQDVTPMSEQAPKAKAAPKADKPKRTAKAKASTKADPVPAPKLAMVQYSPKCLALFGDTKPIKERLKKLGGRFNPNLHPFGQATIVPGWVFPMKCQAELQKLVG